MRSRAAAWPRRLTCNFCRMLCMWFLTVAALIASWRAISLLERPRATSVSQDLALTRRQRRQRRLWLGLAQQAGEAGEHCRRNVWRAVHTTRCRVGHSAIKFAGAAFAWDIAAITGGGAGKHMVVGFVQCESHQLAAGAGGSDGCGGRGRVRLTQIDHHDVGL
jgi:hypothetical protein